MNVKQSTIDSFFKKKYKYEVKKQPKEHEPIKSLLK